MRQHETALARRCPGKNRGKVACRASPVPGLGVGAGIGESSHVMTIERRADTLDAYVTGFRQLHGPSPRHPGPWGSFGAPLLAAAAVAVSPTPKDVSRLARCARRWRHLQRHACTLRADLAADSSPDWPC